ncbi:MAG: hypothetical protein NT105_23365 [Verrucomicrobia bacterium]|nr:hypothetical protein [Verrucomicrobiota bacterium]
MLNLSQLRVAVAAGKQRFDLIRKKHPDLKAYLVLSLPGGQVDIDSSPREILAELSRMVVDDAAKAGALELMSRLERLEWQAKAEPEKERLAKQLDQLALRLRYDAKCQVEIRFKDLNYELIWKLQQDDLVDRNLTPQTKASIRIVLGTISRFAGV